MWKVGEAIYTPSAGDDVVDEAMAAAKIEIEERLKVKMEEIALQRSLRVQENEADFPLRWLRRDHLNFWRTELSGGVPAPFIGDAAGNASSASRCCIP